MARPARGVFALIVREIFPSAVLFVADVPRTSKEWEARGFRACDGRDPEGNVLQVREAAAPSSDPRA